MNTTISLNSNTLDLLFTKTDWYTLEQLYNDVLASNISPDASNAKNNSKESGKICGTNTNTNNINNTSGLYTQMISIGGEIKPDECVFTVCSDLCSIKPGNYIDTVTDNRSDNGANNGADNGADKGTRFSRLSSVSDTLDMASKKRSTKDAVLWQTMESGQEFPTLAQLTTACKYTEHVFVFFSLAISKLQPPDGNEEDNNNNNNNNNNVIDGKKKRSGAYVVAALRPCCKVSDAEYLWNHASGDENRAHFFQTDGALVDSLLNKTNLFMRHIPPEHAHNPANFALQISQIRDLRRQLPIITQKYV